MTPNSETASDLEKIVNSDYNNLVKKDTCRGCGNELKLHSQDNNNGWCVLCGTKNFKENNMSNCNNCNQETITNDDGDCRYCGEHKE